MKFVVKLLHNKTISHSPLQPEEFALKGRTDSVTMQCCVHTQVCIFPGSHVGASSFAFTVCAFP